jgi:hypothetical protein
MKAAKPSIERLSPIHLPGKPEKTETRDGWTVVLEYADEGEGPWVVDLSHSPRWDIQGSDLDAATPKGVTLPAAPGGVGCSAGFLVGRTGMRQAFLWAFNGKLPAMGAGCTETTEGTACLALIGRDVLNTVEKLTSLDLGTPAVKAPFLKLGPFAHLTAQVVVLSADPQAAAVLVACSRGFGHDLAHAVLQAGEEFGLQPAGESRLKAFLPKGGNRKETGSAERKSGAKNNARARAKR